MGAVGEVEEIEIVEIDAKLSNVKLDGDIEAFFVAGFGLDAETCTVEVVVTVESFATTKEVIMEDGEVKVCKRITDMRGVCDVSV